MSPWGSDMGALVDLADFRPHFTARDAVTNTVHVIPVELVAKVIDGRMPLDSCDPRMIRSLLRFLLEEVAHA